jgi:superfamily II DNA/RNA helicase
MRFAASSAIVTESALDIAALLRASLYVDRAGSPGHPLREVIQLERFQRSGKRPRSTAPGFSSLRYALFQERRTALHSVYEHRKEQTVMPQNKTPRPFRASADPSVRKPGSKSAKHRGHRPGEVTPPAGGFKKPRWNSDERVARGAASERPRGAGTGRPQREERPARDGGYSRDNRSADRSAAPKREGWAPKREGWAPKRDYDRSAAPKRDYDRSAAPKRDYDRNAAPKRAADGRPNWEPRGKDARPARDEQRTERPARSYDDRPVRTERPDDRERPRKTWEERPAHRQHAERPTRQLRERAEHYTERPARNWDERPGRPTRSFEHDARTPHQPHDDVVLERLEAQAITAGETDGITFADLGLGQNIVRVLNELGAETPFPIQAATIPDVLSGRDVLGRGRTGSGKTIAFGAPLVERLLKMQSGENQRREFGRAPRALILAPTRELALQIDRTVQPIARSVGLFTTQIYGGVPYARQLGALQRGVDIIIGTPGRVGDLAAQGKLDLSKTVITVLDEADHMCELGFAEPVQEILDLTAPGGQKLMFSATLDKGVAEIVEKYLVDPSVHEVAGEDQASGTIQHRVLLMDQRDKQQVLIELASGPGKKLVFARTRAFAEMLADVLDDAGIRAESIHGDLNQSRRTRALEKFTSGRVDALVATDVAARGIHVDDIALVIQADAPDEYKAYLHRSGRTGRAGKVGTVVTLVPRNRRRRTEELLQRADITAEWISVVPGDHVISELAGN